MSDYYEGWSYEEEQERLVKIWKCHVHRDNPGGCWADSHLSFWDVLRQTLGPLKCAPECQCWRHKIIDHVRSNRALYHLTEGALV